MELRPHFRVVRFSPAPEYVEYVNVALLILDSKPRLVTDFQFEKLGCIAPAFNPSLLKSWLEHIAEDVRSLPPREISAHVVSTTSQVRLGAECFLDRDVPPDLEKRLISTYLKRGTKHAKQSDEPQQYVDSLISNAIGGTNLIYGELHKRAKPDAFLSPASVTLLSVRNIKFSRVLAAPRSLILMDGINLALANRAQIRQRATDIDFGYFAFGEVKQRLESIEQREIVRTAFIFHRPPNPDREIDYLSTLVQRNADQGVDADKTEEIFRFNTLLRAKSSE